LGLSRQGACRRRIPLGEAPKDQFDCKSRLTTRRADCEPVRTCARDAAGSYATCIYRQSTRRPAFFRVRGLGGLYRNRQHGLLSSVCCEQQASRHVSNGHAETKEHWPHQVRFTPSNQNWRCVGHAPAARRAGPADQKTDEVFGTHNPAMDLRKMRGNLLRH
jgi:hypothetical protein